MYMISDQGMDRLEMISHLGNDLVQNRMLAKECANVLLKVGYTDALVP